MRSGEFDLAKSKEFLHNVSKLFGSTGGGGVTPSSMSVIMKS
ncbi:hypothetical protein ACVM3D_001000 [Campylobacter upsaliensis]|nr:hypothetical protein [Campylobacter upsaliensis]MEB2789707.1 hypothetical protein [Campylobacter upsaliensis]